MSFLNYITEAYIIILHSSIPHVKVTLTEAIHRQRVRAAGKLLLDGSASLTELAIRCGFNDVDYFRQIFTKHTGLTPVVWKREYINSG